MYQKQRTTKSYSITSPYMQLLESKKKVYGLKYHSNFGVNASNSKPNPNHNTSNHMTSSTVKGRPASSSLASHHNKSNIKSNSSQKVKSTKSQHTKKKRIYTEQAQTFNQLGSDPKMHQSLFVNMDKDALNSKSLFYHNPNSNLSNLEFIQAKQNNYLNNYDFLKKFSEFNANIKQKQQQIINFSGSKSQKSNKSTKSKGKGKTKSKQQQNNNNNNNNNNINSFNNNFNSNSINYESVNLGKSIQQLGLVQVQDLICLIDNCVEQANQYISFLASKVQSLKNQLMKCKTDQFELERIIKEKNHELEQKDNIIFKLKKQIELIKSSSNTLSSHFNGQFSTSFGINQEIKPKQMKKILQVLNQMNQQNTFLQSKIKNLQIQLTDLRKRQTDSQFIESKQSSQENDEELRSKYQQENRKNSSGKQKDSYNEIHSKIDILNISIDNNKKIIMGHEYDGKIDGKKYKFIKPKNK